MTSTEIDTATVIHYNPCATHGATSSCGPECCTCLHGTRAHVSTCPATYNPEVHAGQVTLTSGTIDLEARYDVYYIDETDVTMMQLHGQYSGGDLAALFQGYGRGGIVARKLDRVVVPATACFNLGPDDCDATPTFTLDYGVGGTTVCDKHLGAALLWCAETRPTLVVTRVHRV